MAVYTWQEGNGGVWAYSDLGLFDITTMTTTGLQGQYNGGDGPYDPFSHAWSVEASLSGASLYTIQEGPNAGSQAYNGGRITGLDFYDNAHNLLVSVSGLSLNLAAFMTLGAQGSYLWDYISARGSTFIGSMNSMGNGFNGDDIRTGAGNDTVLARGGDDFITDLGGSDVYKGGGGFDTITYDNWQWYTSLVKSGITANLAQGWIRGPDGKIDHVYSIENVRGTFLRDTFIGNAQDNSFVGLQGNDVIRGGAGFDIVRYDLDERRGGTDGVLVNLAAQTARDGFGNTDTLSAIEGARGTNQKDIFIDNGRDNFFRGEGGNDIFRLHGGSDHVIGGSGADEFQFLGGAFGDDTIEDFSQGDGDLIVIQGPAGMGDLTISQNGSDAVIDYGANSITLQNFNAGSLSAGDFLFV